MLSKRLKNLLSKNWVRLLGSQKAFIDKNKTLAYVQSALSFIFSDSELWKKPLIKRIILFGSAARGEATKESDIDLFVEPFLASDENFIKNKISFALQQFSQSRLYTEWSLREVKNELQIFVSTLQKSSDLQRSLIADGIVLFGEFMTKLDFRHNLLVSFAPIKQKNKRYRIDRYLFGRKERERAYEGMVQELGGIKIDARAFILPSQRAQQVLKKLREEKVDFSIRDFWCE